MAAIGLSGCGSTLRSAAQKPSAIAAAFEGSPAALASVHAQSSQLLGGGEAAFKARLLTLRGFPVVVNKWASWCTPCESEFPFFQRAAVTFGRQVAFVGIDGQDTQSAAASFLRQFPVPYPSYLDPHESIANMIQAAQYFPFTIYFDRSGNSTFSHVGAYTSTAALDRDIRRYALQ
jgi:thiol-disulfide isomerase/thioredoxin